MFNFQNIKKVSKEADKQDQQRTKSAEDSYNRAVVFIKRFNTEKTYNSKYLLEAAKLLSQAVTFKKTIPEPYFLLSYIFYLMNKDDLSLKYLKIARNIQPEMPGISQMQQLLSSTNSALYAQTVKKMSKEVVNHEFNGEIKIVTSLASQIGNAELKKKSSGNLEFNGESKAVTTLGKKIQRVTRLGMGES